MGVGGEADLGQLRPCQRGRAALLGLEVQGLRLGQAQLHPTCAHPGRKAGPEGDVPTEAGSGWGLLGLQ